MDNTETVGSYFKDNLPFVGNDDYTTFVAWDAMPQDSFLEYPIGAANTTYVAEDDGFVVLAVTGNKELGIRIISEYGYGQECSVFGDSTTPLLPVIKNSKFTLYHEGSKENIKWLRLYKAEKFQAKGKK